MPTYSVNLLGVKYDQSYLWFTELKGCVRVDLKDWYAGIINYSVSWKTELSIFPLCGTSQTALRIYST